MPVDYRIDPARRLVWARLRGRVGAEDLFSYQREVWSKPEVAGFDELVDVSEVKEVVYEGPQRARELAALSAEMDAPGPSRLAIVAPNDELYGLARMYQTFRELDPRTKRMVRVFRSETSALTWLADAKT
jgi:hypothetical protein